MIIFPLCFVIGVTAFTKQLVWAGQQGVVIYSSYLSFNDYNMSLLFRDLRSSQSSVALK